MPKSPRHSAYRILLAWEQDSSTPIDDILHQQLAHSKHSRDERGWIMESVYGTMRQMGRLDAIISHYYRGRYRKAQHGVKTLLRLGAFQLLDMKTPDHAAIHEMVNLAKQVGQRSTAGMVNAILRNIAKEGADKAIASLPAGLPRLSAEYSHPIWLLERWQDSYGLDATEKLCGYDNKAPQTWIRRNSLFIEQEQFEKFLATTGSQFQIFPPLPSYYRVENGSTLLHTPEFEAGWFSYQDPAAGVITSIMEASAGDVIIDACSAPGGKASYMAEMSGGQAVIHALDASPKRLERVQESAQRLHLKGISVATADARVDTFPLANKILLDVPCSGTGVLGRRPDSRWRKTADDLNSLNEIQTAILQNAWKQLPPGGLLVYATCSLEFEENWGLIENNLEQLEGAVIEPVVSESLKAYVDERGAVSTLPWEHDIDGMFAVKLRKRL